MQDEHGQQRCPDGDGSDQQAGSTGGDPDLAVIECEIIERYANGARADETGDVAQSGPAEMSQAGVDGQGK